MNLIDQVELQEYLVNKKLSNKTCYSKSTQTEDLSVLKCKHNLPEKYDTNQNTCIHLKRSKTSSIHRSSSVS